MSSRSAKIKRVFFLIIPILIGILIFFIFIKTKQGPPKKERLSNVRKVRTYFVNPIDVIPITHGYGTVQPVTTWQAVSEVSGKAIMVNPLLKKGQMVKKGSVLIKIDPTEYEFSVSEAKASLANIEAQIKQLQDKKVSNTELLKLEMQVLKLKEAELKRQKKLVSEKFSSDSDYESAESTYISQKYKVQALKNSLNSHAAEFESLEAQKEQVKIQLSSAQLQLEYTVIKAPYSGLVSSVSLEQAQFVQKGQTLTEIEAVDAVEIEAQISNGLYVFRPRLEETKRERILDGSRTLSESLGIKAIVTPTTGRFQVQWEGEVMRFNASIDTTTRTPGLIIQVKNPYKMRPDKPSPPLVKGMYCEVEIFGSPFKDQIIVPRSAVHENNIVYVVNSENQLEFRTIEVGFSQDSFSVVRSGLKAGEQLIVTDVVPAVEGMAVEPVIDQAIANLVKSDATRGI